MRTFIRTLLLSTFSFSLLAQPSPDSHGELTVVRKVEHTPVKNQANTGTCWSFSTVSLLESQTMHNRLGEFDLSEMFVVRNIYTEKARNYILRQGKAQFGPGGLGHDVVNAIEKYGIVPEGAYSGLLLGKRSHDHEKMDEALKIFLDSVLTKRPIAADWMQRFQSILDEHLGKTPETFIYNERTYTPKTFATEVLKFRKDDYLFVTSFTHHPFYAPFVLEIPDNYGSESYYNIPLEEMVTLVKDAVSKGYSVMWDADVSNANFRQKDGYAMQWLDAKKVSKPINPDATESKYNAETRQQLFESLVIQDDHLMHLVGLEKSAKGKTFFLVKNSWGSVGPFDGYIKVSEDYFGMNTISLVVPKAALSNGLLSKLKLD